MGNFELRKTGLFDISESLLALIILHMHNLTINQYPYNYNLHVTHKDWMKNI